MQRNVIIGGAVAGGLLVLFWPQISQAWSGKTINAKLSTAGAKLKARKSVSLIDPCKGFDTVWDAGLKRCVPLREEPLTVQQIQDILK